MGVEDVLHAMQEIFHRYEKRGKASAYLSMGGGGAKIVVLCGIEYSSFLPPG